MCFQKPLVNPLGRTCVTILYRGKTCVLVTVLARSQAAAPLQHTGNSGGDQPQWGLPQLQRSLGWVCSWDVECLGAGDWCLCASAVTGVLDPPLVLEDPKILPRRRSNSSESPPWPHYTTFPHLG